MRYTIETNSGELDMYYDYDVSLNYQLNDILDLNSRNTNWSKTLKIPGTPTNNKFFENIYEVNIDNYYTFNPLQKVPAKLKVGDDVVFDGYMQLLNIQETNKDIEYEVSLVGKIGTLFAKFGDYTLGQFDLSEYDHVRSRDTIIDSWEDKIYKNGFLYQAEPGEGYVYPYIKYDEHANANFMAVESMYPAFYVKTIVDKMFQSAGFTYTSNFFNGDIFTKLIIPFNGNKLQLDGNGGISQSIDYFSTIGGITGFTSTNPFLECEYRGSIFQGSNAYNQAAQFFNSWGGKWMYGTTGPNRGSGSLLGTNFSDASGQIMVGDPLDLWQNGFEVQDTATYDIDIDLSLAPIISNLDVIKGDDSVVEWKEGALQWRYQLILIKPDGTQQVLDNSNNHGGQGTYGIFDFNLETGPKAYNYNQNGIKGHIYENIDLNVVLSAKGVNLKKGDKIIVRVGCAMPQRVKFYTTSFPVITTSLWNARHRVTLLPRNKKNDNSYVSTASLKRSENSISANSYISSNQILDYTIKQKDLFLSLVKMFNLVVSDNPNKENDLIIEPYDDWYSTKPYVREWGPKLDEDSLIKITPMSELDFNKYRFTYKEDGDFLNTEYTEESDGLIFGEYSNVVDNPFTTNVSTIQPIFSPTPVMENNGVIAPFFTTFENDEYSPFKTNIRILFWNGLQPWGGMKLYDTIDDFINQPDDANYYKLTDAYPQATMWNDINNPTDSLEFGRSVKQYFTTDKFAAGTLVEKYHRNLIESVISPNSKLMECEIVLTPKEMAEFDFRDLIYIREAYWRVNEIKDYNPINSDKKTTVVLYKVLNVDYFEKFQVEIPNSNIGCKPYVIKKEGFRIYYQNTDGTNPTLDCCTKYGGTIDGTGRCVVTTKKPEPPLGPFKPILNPPFDGPETWTPWTGNIDPIYEPITNKRPIGGIWTIPVEQKEGPSVLNKNKTKNRGIYVKTQGFNNVIQRDAKNTLIIGDENTITSEVKNNIILGDGIIARNEGSIYLQNAEITKFGEIKQYGYKVIDGGEDTVFPFNKTNPTEIIDGTIDSVRNPGAYSWSRPIIDGDGFNVDGNVS